MGKIRLFGLLAVGCMIAAVVGVFLGRPDHAVVYALLAVTSAVLSHHD